MGINQNCMSFGMAASKSIQRIIWEINSLFSAGLHVLFVWGDIRSFFFFFFQSLLPSLVHPNELQKIHKSGRICSDWNFIPKSLNTDDR